MACAVVYPRWALPLLFIDKKAFLVRMTARCACVGTPMTRMDRCDALGTIRCGVGCTDALDLSSLLHVGVIVVACAWGVPSRGRRHGVFHREPSGSLAACSFHGCKYSQGFLAQICKQLAPLRQQKDGRKGHASYRARRYSDTAVCVHIRLKSREGLDWCWLSWVPRDRATILWR